MTANVKTFQARTLAEALRQIREEFGPQAMVLGSESRQDGLWSRICGKPSVVEVTAMRPALSTRDFDRALPGDVTPHFPTHDNHDVELGFNESYRDRFKRYASDDQQDSLLESMIGEPRQRLSRQLQASLFRLYQDLVESDVDDRFARELIEEIQRHSTPAELGCIQKVKENAINNIVGRIRTAPLINSYSERRVVALVGPTGVGKTTTIAKLAANLRLRDKRRVGLITVDTYRIAAVEQLRAYAQIIDLPMEVVTTPKEMRDATTKLSDVDIVLIDTAGRSGHDEVQIQELKSMLAEAHTNEVHLVLSSIASGQHLMRLIDHFGVSRPTSLLLTKLDELTGYGHLLPLLCGPLPLSYTTHGQNVPDDIQGANPRLLAESVVN